MFNFSALRTTAATILTLPAALHKTVDAIAMTAESAAGTDCHGQLCHPVEQFCSHFEVTCVNCSSACDPQDLNYKPVECTRECGEFLKLLPLQNEIHQIQTQQSLILYLLIFLLIITCLHYTWVCLKWLRQQRCFRQVLKKLQLKKGPLPPTAHVNGKDTTIQNMCVINDVERAPSQIYSMTGVEGSVMTMTTPISSRHPAENQTPSPQAITNEYSYDNQALAVTPVSEKPGGGSVVF
ncbi:protein grindelwald-like [Musca vetustissima]|uniref:protein grindelwald-like n=1 Tax=Musca vetustissima TaxID=27455 RepID=UPI002AB78493|nr:protein grindelwald-like [Musca vetustissima]